MEWVIGEYVGRINNDYVFMDKDGIEWRFNKCRSDLIDNFKLHKNNSVNQWFVISYFIPKVIKPLDFDRTVMIISDLEILNEISKRKIK